MEIYNYNPYKRRKTYKYIFIYTPHNITCKELVKFCNNNYKNNPIILLNATSIIIYICPYITLYLI